LRESSSVEARAGFGKPPNPLEVLRRLREGAPASKKNDF